MESIYKRLLKFFSYEHLPSNLQISSKPFHDLAHTLAENAENNGYDVAETMVALRKLLEAKDCAVRSMIN